MNNLDLSATFRLQMISQLLSNCYEWAEKEDKAKAIQGLSELTHKLEERMISKFTQYPQQVVESFIKHAIKHRPASPVLQLFLEITARAINEKGESCIHPEIIVDSLSWLTQPQLLAIKEVSPHFWEKSFLLFVTKYFGKETKWRRIATIQKVLLGLTQK